MNRRSIAYQLERYQSKPNHYRQRYSAEFKFEVALAAAKGQKTANELAGEYAVHPNQISQWKRSLLEDGASLFASQRASQQRAQAAQQAELFEQIGRLKMELEWLKKKAARYG